MVNYKVSIIIPVYNMEEFLHKSFESLKRQTIGFSNLQVIFADDCSTDKSWQTIQEFAAIYSNVESVQLLNNSGAAGAPRNAAMELARAKYFMCLDPDDELDDDACRVLLDAIEQESVDFAFGYHSEIDAQGAIQQEKPQRYTLFEEKIYNFPNDLALFALQGTHFAAKIYKTDLCRERNLCFPVGIPGQDTVFYINYLFEAKNAVYVDRPVYKYTMHPNSISFSHTKRFFIGINTCYKLCYELFNKFGYVEHYGLFIGSVLSFYLNKMFDSALSDNDIIEIFKDWCWMWNYYDATGLVYRSEYAEIIGASFHSGNRLEVYNNLRKLRLYTLDLENAKGWFIEQIENRDEIIYTKDRIIGEIHSDLEEQRMYTLELENAKEWFLLQIEHKDIAISEKDKKIIEKDRNLNKALVRFALKLSGGYK